MNIVRGVVHLIRRSSSGHTPEPGVGSSMERFLLPSTKIRFSGIGDEAILSTLWEKYIDAFDKVERQKCFLMFLKQFIIVYKNWKPVDSWQSPQAAASASPPVECSQQADVIYGCSAGHPAEIVLALTEEISHITAMVSECIPSNTSERISTTERLGTVTSLTLTSEGLPILGALTIVTRSMHNCNVFGYYGGIQKVTSLMKAAVVQLKTITSAVPEDKSSSNSVKLSTFNMSNCL